MLDDIDEPIRALVQQLNLLPGIKTVCSCCGDEKDIVRIWLKADTIKHVNLFIWAGWHRYWCWGEFIVKLEHADPDPKSSELLLIMESKQTGPLAYAEANNISMGLIEFLLDVEYYQWDKEE